MNLILLALLNLAQLSFKPTCKCLPISVEDNFKLSKIVFSGKVIKIDTTRINIAGMEKGSFYETQLISILKSDVFKGPIQKDTITVMTGIGGGDCGYQFKINTDYLVYADKYDYNIIDSIKPSGDLLIKKVNYFRTSNCSRTTDSVNIEKARLLFFLKRRKTNGA